MAHHFSYLELVAYAFCGLASIWIIVRVAGSAWYSAKRAYTAALVHLIDKNEERTKNGGQK
jgi:hypothetical protein